MSLPASVEGSERLRLFCALRLPHETAERLTVWQRAKRWFSLWSGSYVHPDGTIELAARRD